MQEDLEALMARGRAAGVTQLTATEIQPDGRHLRLDPGGPLLLSFATCNYLGLDRDPRLARGAIDAVERFGVSFNASRCFVTTALYAEVDALLARVFDRPVVLAGSTTLAHGAALPILLDPRDVVLYDRQVHHSVQTALAALGPRRMVCRDVVHSDLPRLDIAIEAALAMGARRIWYCADGIYSMFGDRLPVEGLAERMRRYPALHVYLDDAHGMSWCGARGGGSLVDAGLPRERTIIATSLSKAFGCAGGVIVVPDEATKHRIENLGPSLMFSIQLPPPVLGAIAASARIHLTDEIADLQRGLAERLRFARARIAEDEVLRQHMPSMEAAPSPVHYLVLGDGDDAVDAARRLIGRGFLVNPVAYPAVPRGMGGLRFTIARSHTEDDIRALLRALREVADERRPAPAQAMA